MPDCFGSGGLEAVPKKWASFQRVLSRGEADVASDCTGDCLLICEVSINCNVITLVIPDHLNQSLAMNSIVSFGLWEAASMTSLLARHCV